MNAPAPRPSARSSTRPAATQPPENLRYARVLAWGTWASVVVLALGFLAYVSGLMAPQVPLDQLPALWSRPVAEFRQATGTPSGWGWAGLLTRGDMASLLGIALLSSCSVLGLLALLPLCWRRGDKTLAALALTEVLIIALAASGWPGPGG